MALAVAATMVVAAGLAVAWLRASFEEPSATDVVSLAAHLSVRSVLAVLAHPDDEILIAGVLADAAAREGIRVKTLTLTRGEAATAPAPLARSDHMAVIRTAELYKFGFVLGVDEQDVLDYPDGQLESQAPQAITDAVVAAIRGWRPDLVVTFDPEAGVTRHPDHIAVGRTARRALPLASNPGYGPELGAAWRVTWMAYVVNPTRLLLRFGGEAGRDIAARQPRANTAVRVPWRLKVRGWDIHESQRHVIREVFGVSPGLLYRFYDREFYHVLRSTP